MFEGSRGISAPQQVYDKDGKPVHFNSSDEYNAWASANPELADPDTQKTLKTKATANLLYGPEPTMPGYNRPRHHGGNPRHQPRHDRVGCFQEGGP
jgi:hypothetical protein